MEDQNKQDKMSHQEAVQRFCPVLQKNVVMLRHSSDSGDTFECIDNTKCENAAQSCRHYANYNKSS